MQLNMLYNKDKKYQIKIAKLKFKFMHALNILPLQLVMIKILELKS
jgi:hypothetical protein